MARVVMQAVVSVDGYIAYPDDTVGPLFDWYGNGDTEVSARASGWTFHVSQASADYVQPFWNAIKVTVIGRHLFDTTNGWQGRRPRANMWSWCRTGPSPMGGDPRRRGFNPAIHTHVNRARTTSSMMWHGRS